LQYSAATVLIQRNPQLGEDGVYFLLRRCFVGDWEKTALPQLGQRPHLFCTCCGGWEPDIAAVPLPLT